MNVEILKNLIKKCDIYFEDQLISSELLLRVFIDFLNDEADRPENEGSIILHPASPCFDAIAVSWSALAVIVGNSADVESIIRMLQPGEMILCGKERGEFVGIETDANEKEWAVIRQGKSLTKKIGRKGWSTIIPYYGNSNRYDGRGIRRGNSMREEFLSVLLECDKKDIPSITDASVIIVMDRSKADRYMNGLMLKTGNTVIRIQDLVTASYFSEENEYPYGGNAGKNEAMLKFTSKLSVGLDMTWNEDGNEYLGMFVCGNSLIERGITEIPQVMSRESIGFSFISGCMDLRCAENLLTDHEEARVFACTKKFLLEHTLPPVNRNAFAMELALQADAIIDHEIHTTVLPGATDWKDYRDFKKAVYSIKRDELSDEERSCIIPNAYSLLNLFMTAPFCISEMEDAVNNGKIRVEQPHDRLEKLERRLDALPINLAETAERVGDLLETLYYTVYDASPKREYLKEYIRKHYGHKIAVIVPKAYYADIIWNYVLTGYDMEKSKIEIVTINRFDGNRNYDYILVIGNLKGKHFDIFHCMSTAEITVLMYKAESMVFRLAERKSQSREHLFNSRQRVSDELSEDIAENISNGDIEEIERVDDEIAVYVDEIVESKFDTVIRRERENGTVPLTEVSTLIRFDDGEGAMLSSHYEAYVLNDEKGEVEKKKVDALKIGDSLIFLNRDDDTRDIVDYVLKELIREKRISPKTVQDYEMSRRWKNDLSEYMEKTGYSPKRIADIMKANGVRVQKASIINWLDDDAHIVAPQTVESLEQIALLTDDTDMFDHVNEYFDACRRIRKVRKNILKELGTAIIRQLEGQETSGTLIPLEIRKHLDTLAVVLRIENIVQTNRSEPSYLTNRPLDLEGGF